MGRYQSQPTQRRPWLSWTIIALPLAMLTLLSSREFIGDQLNLVPEPPSAEAERLAQATTMTPRAQRLFYRHRPDFASRETFLDKCNVPKDAIVLGCYLEKSQGDRILSGKIIIQDIRDPQFSGTMEVTAAHEMLHAAYARLSPQQQEALFQQLKIAKLRVTDEKLLQVLDEYKGQEEKRYRHELHSHLGTELKDLGNPELEAHYQQYFSDRQRVIAFAEQSVRVFNDFEQRAEALAAEIEQFEQQLTASQAELEAEEARLSRVSADLEQRKAALENTRTAAESALTQGNGQAERLINQFEQGKIDFNRQVDDYNAQVQANVQRIDRFNQSVQDYQQKIDAYNQIAQNSRKALESLKGATPAANESPVEPDLAPQ
ncbi:MAG: hypothetical protein HC824_09125 [Synechococcales cyanobacterium RM1_1_8]|nr:hypothetical protein [Synechococcales cyanobacterium RM1_1_8]